MLLVSYSSFYLLLDTFGLLWFTYSYFLAVLVFRGLHLVFKKRKCPDTPNYYTTQLVSFDRSNSTGASDVKMDGSVLEEKSSFEMLGLSFSSKLDWGSYIISIAKTASKKTGALIRSVKFVSPEVALYLYKSTIRPCMEYCGHVWVGSSSCYLELLDKLEKRICRTVGLVLHLLLLLNP